MLVGKTITQLYVSWPQSGITCSWSFLSLKGCLSLDRRMLLSLIINSSNSSWKVVGSEKNDFLRLYSWCSFVFYSWCSFVFVLHKQVGRIAGSFKTGWDCLLGLDLVSSILSNVTRNHWTPPWFQTSQPEIFVDQSLAESNPSILAHPLKDASLNFQQIPEIIEIRLGTWGQPTWACPVLRWLPPSTPGFCRSPTLCSTGGRWWWLCWRGKIRFTWKKFWRKQIFNFTHKLLTSMTS